MELIIILSWMTLGIVGVAFSQWPLILAFVVIGTAGAGLTLKRNQPFTDGTVYTAIRLSKNNFLFPTQVIVQPTRVIRRQARFTGLEEESISLLQIASVKIITGLLWSDVIIESTGGQNQIVCHGHTNHDAIAIKADIERYQSQRPDDPTPSYQPPHHPSASGMLLLSLYSASPPDINRLERWPTPIKRLQINADDTASLLHLLHEGGAGCHVRVQLL
jgi:hypothetical protein